VTDANRPLNAIRYARDVETRGKSKPISHRRIRNDPFTMGILTQFRILMLLTRTVRVSSVSARLSDPVK